MHLSQLTGRSQLLRELRAANNLSWDQ